MATAMIVKEKRDKRFYVILKSFLNQNNINLIGFASAVLFLTATSAFAATGTLSLGSATGVSGGEATVGLQAMTDFDRSPTIIYTEVEYDSSQLTFVLGKTGGAIEAEELSYTEPPMDVPGQPGKKKVAVVIAEGAFASEAIYGLRNGEMAKLTFRINQGVATGSAVQLVLMNSRMVDRQSTRDPILISVTPINGAINVGPPIIYGDANGDGSFSLVDASMLIGWWLGLQPMPQPGNVRFLAADVNGDGQLNLTDASLMIAKWLGKINKFPVEP